jgi:hypothetical protein
MPRPVVPDKDDATVRRSVPLDNLDGWIEAMDAAKVDVSIGQLQ